MIETFKHKGLKRFFETGSTAGAQANHAKRLRMQLAALDTAQIIGDMALPGFESASAQGETNGSVVDISEWKLEDHL